ncbi:unnamed protein product [Linum trigynum]|uniref:Uncharacterized protein n=1 Tax=Linum trigynum TaxID=586398 RepID=A0AAV2EEE1_9ROSI
MIDPDGGLESDDRWRIQSPSMESVGSQHREDCLAQRVCEFIYACYLIYLLRYHWLRRILLGRSRGWRNLWRD